MMNRSKATEAMAEALKNLSSVLICGHKRPDFDALGSQFALATALKRLGVDARVFTPGPVAPGHRLLPGSEHLEDSVGDDFQPEATLLLDCSSPSRVHEGFESRGELLVVDHHATNDGANARLKLLDASASSTGELVFDVIEQLGVDVDPGMGLCLYAAIMTDTGAFRYSNTTPRCLEIAARLVAAGVNPAEAGALAYEMRDPLSLRLAGEALSRVRFEFDGAFVWTEITSEMFDDAGGRDHEPEELVSYLRAARGVRVSALFKQTEDGVRVSLRAKGEAAVNHIAELFGGGGHRAASGIEIEGDYAGLRDKVLEAIRAAGPYWIPAER